MASYFNSLRYLGALGVSAVNDLPAINRREAEDAEFAQRRNVKLGHYRLRVASEIVLINRRAETLDPLLFDDLKNKSILSGGQFSCVLLYLLSQPPQFCH